VEQVLEIKLALGPRSSTKIADGTQL